MFYYRNIYCNTWPTPTPNIPFDSCAANNDLKDVKYYASPQISNANFGMCSLIIFCAAFIKQLIKKICHMRGGRVPNKLIKPLQLYVPLDFVCNSMADCQPLSV